MAQVRLDADVADALRAIAETEPGSSVAQLANRRLRSALGLDKSLTRREANNGIRNAGIRRKSTLRAAPSERCRHPVGRRIAGICMMCGETVNR